jgi:hypothetical protein
MLGGLVAMAEMGLIRDSRCDDALDLLEKKERPNGGWAAQGIFYKVSASMDMSTRFGSRRYANGSLHIRRTCDYQPAVVRIL